MFTKLILSLLLVLTSFNLQADSRKQISLLFDAEINSWLKNAGKPFLLQSGIDPNDIEYRVIIDDTINAFVTPDKKIYFNTGLLLKASSAEEVIGVMAHEIAHLKARHHMRVQKKINKLSMPMILGTLVGMGAVAAGAGELGNAILVGSQAAMQGNMLKFSRTQEKQADNIALELLTKANISPQGLITFLEKLRGNKLLYSHNIPPYLSTHPLSSARIEAIRAYTKKNIKNTIVKTDKITFARLQAKIFASSNSLGATLRKYNDHRKVDHQYARMVSYGINGKTKESLKYLTNLMKQFPRDPFLYETSGQLKLNMGNLNSSATNFASALAIRDDLPLIRLQYGEVLTNLKQYNKALKQFLRLRHELPSWPSIVHKIAIIYGKQNKLGLSHIALAEEAIMLKDIPTAKGHITYAKKYIDTKNKVVLNKLKQLEKVIVEE